LELIQIDGTPDAGGPILVLKKFFQWRIRGKNYVVLAGKKVKWRWTHWSVRRFTQCGANGKSISPLSPAQKITLFPAQHQYANLKRMGLNLELADEGIVTRPIAS